MNKNNHPIEDWSIPVPLTSEILRIARQFAREQLIPEKAQQVYFNTLAVCTVNNYLRILGISTNLWASDSWNSSIRIAEDIADLWVTGKGSLECRAIKPGANSCYIPSLVGFDRIGYVVVEIDESVKQAILRGFAPNTVKSGDLSLHDLHSLEYLPQYLYKLRPLVNLSQWFKNIFETNWESIEAVLGNEATEPALAFRSIKASNLKRCKLLKLGTQEELVAFIVNIAPESDSNINILVELMPANNRTYLPANLQLILLDEDEQAIINTKTKGQNQHIQLDLSAEPGERFSIKVVLGEESFREDFMI
ncbi:MAG: DUF1822 family protein [Rivularia sp. (in: cyanobacteria)]|jgi:hypothetical protein